MIPVAGELKRRLGAALIGFGRWRVARGCLRGHGLEIGALHAPFRLPRSASATYLDRLPARELRFHYPELADERLVEPDVIDDAETLGTVASSSQDFVIASHVLEHCEDPVGAVRNWLRVVCPGGVVLLAVPDKRRTFDRPRPTTSLAHLVRDHAEGPAGSRDQHYLEWARLVEGASGERAEGRARELRDTGYRIHFHAWDRNALRDLLDYCAAGTAAPGRLVRLNRNRSENLAVLVRRRGVPGEASSDPPGPARPTLPERP